MIWYNELDMLIRRMHIRMLIRGRLWIARGKWSTSLV